MTAGACGFWEYFAWVACHWVERGSILILLGGSRMNFKNFCFDQPNIDRDERFCGSASI
jgi:hypothetical protein